MGALLRRTGRRAARAFGFDLKRIVEPGAACVNLMCEIRALLPAVDPDSHAFLRFCLENLALSKSQILQDLFVLFETGGKRGGYFVEFGAADGIRGSNTYMLETEFGWTGIVADPARVWHEALDSNRRCIVDHRCVTDRSGDTVTFNQCELRELSTIDAYSFNDRFGHMRRRGTRYAVGTVALNDLLAEHGAPADIDYLSVDTEGSELTILRALDFARHRPRIITVEHCHSPARDRLFDLLAGHGYRRKHESLSQIEDWYVLA